MEREGIDLRREQQATADRPRYPYSAAARVFFGAMDRLAGPETTLAKARMVEALASIPYRAWERRQLARMSLAYDDPGLYREGRELVGWAREAQDNEYWHLLVVNEKLRQEGTEDPRYMTRPIPFFMLPGYTLLMWAMARLGSRRSYLLNAELEDHSEHYYAELVAVHPDGRTSP